MRKSFLTIDNMAIIRNRNTRASENHPTLTILQKSMGVLCKVIGHSWNYKDYSYWMKENGDKYDFKASRNCILCHQNEYLYDVWKSAPEKSPYDAERDVYSTRKLVY